MFESNDLYQFQVSSTKGIISHLFNLNVLEPQAHILGAKEYHVQRGTVISLVCIIENVRFSIHFLLLLGYFRVF